MDLDRMREILRSLALAHGLTDADLNAYNEDADEFEWNINWNSNLTESFVGDMTRLEVAANLYEAALKKGDRLTAKAGLIRMGVQLHNLEGLFNSLRRDVEKAYLDVRFDWPQFPDENWKIPQEYNFKE